MKRISKRLVFSGVLLLVGVIIVEILTSHDEPLVIDNGPFQVSRKGTTPERRPPGEGEVDHWRLHESLWLTRLKVQVRRPGQKPWVPESVSLVGVGKEGVKFVLIDINAPRIASTDVTIYRDPIGTTLPWSQSAHMVSSNQAFEVVEGYLRPAGGQDLRIREITVGDKNICVWDQSTDQPCSNNPPPRETVVDVVICTIGIPVKCPSFPK